MFSVLNFWIFNKCILYNNDLSNKQDEHTVINFYGNGVKTRGDIVSEIANYISQNDVVLKAESCVMNGDRDTKYSYNNHTFSYIISYGASTIRMVSLELSTGKWLQHDIDSSVTQTDLSSKVFPNGKWLSLII